MSAIFYVLLFVGIGIISYIGLVTILKDKTSSLQKAEKLKNAGNYDDAIEIYNNLILKDQFNPVYHALLADVYYETNNLKRAIVEYEIALKNEKDLTVEEIRNINKRMGIAYFKIKNYPKAFLSLFNSYLSSQNQPEVCMYIGLVYASQRKWDKALEYFSKSENMDPRNYEIHYYLGIVAAVMNKKDLAIREFTFAKKYKTNNYYLDIYIGALLRENRDYMNAIKHLKLASRNVPDAESKLKSYLIMGECYKGLGLIEDAITSLEMASQESSGPVENKEQAEEMRKNVMYNLGLAYVKGGQRSKALSTLNDLKNWDFFYRDVKELTSSEVSDETLSTVSDKWMVMPSISTKDILPMHEIVSKKMFDINTLEKSVEKNLQEIKSDVVSTIEKYKKLHVSKFKDVSRKLLHQMGFAISKELTFSYDSDFKEGKAVAFVGVRKKERYLIVIKRYEQNISGVVIMNAVGSAKTMGINNVVVMITSRFNQDALAMAKKNPNLTIVDRRGLVKGLKAVMK